MSSVGVLVVGVLVCALGAFLWWQQRGTSARRGSVLNSFAMRRPFGPDGSQDSVKAVASCRIALGALFALTGGLAIAFGYNG